MGDRVAALRRLGCLLVPGFAAAAAVRAEPALAGQPLVILDEARPGRLVRETSAAARALGIVPGMTEAAALARPARVICRRSDIHPMTALVRVILTLMGRNRQARTVVIHRHGDCGSPGG